MKTTLIFWIGNLIFAGIIVSYAFWEKFLWIWMAFTMTWIIFWGLSRLLENSFTPGIFFVVFLGVCLFGSFLGLRSIFLFLGITAALNAWDTDRFYKRWKDALLREGNINLERRHIYRLLLVNGVAIVIGILGLSIQTQLSFGLMLMVGVIALVSLSQLIRLLRNTGSKT